MLNDFPKLKDVFPFECKSAILHGEEAIEFVYQKLKGNILTYSEDRVNVEKHEIQDTKA
jgi:hypothetical protein